MDRRLRARSADRLAEYGRAGAPPACPHRRRGRGAFVDALQRTWADARRRAADRSPAAEAGGRCACSRPCGVDDDVDDGDALVVATSGTTGAPEGRRAHPRRGAGVGTGDERAARRRPVPRPVAERAAARPRRRAVGRDARAAHRHAAHVRPRRPSPPRWCRWWRRRCVAPTSRRFRAVVVGGAAPPADLPAQRRHDLRHDRDRQRRRVRRRAARRRRGASRRRRAARARPDAAALPIATAPTRRTTTAGSPPATPARSSTVAAWSCTVASAT